MLPNSCPHKFISSVHHQVVNTVPLLLLLTPQTDYKPQPGSLGAKLRPLSEAQELLQWFKQRNVSEETLQRNGVMMEMRFCKALNKTVPHIAFPYYKNGGIVNVKYRALEKHFSQSMGGEQIFYGYDDAKVTTGAAGMMAR